MHRDGRLARRLHGCETHVVRLVPIGPLLEEVLHDGLVAEFGGCVEGRAAQAVGAVLVRPVGEVVLHEGEVSAAGGDVEARLWVGRWMDGWMGGVDTDKKKGWMYPQESRGCMMMRRNAGGAR